MFFDCMFRGCAHMREAIEDHWDISVGISRFPIGWWNVPGPQVRGTDDVWIYDLRCNERTSVSTWLAGIGGLFVVFLIYHIPETCEIVGVITTASTVIVQENEWISRGEFSLLLLEAPIIGIYWWEKLTNQIFLWLQSWLINPPAWVPWGHLKQLLRETTELPLHHHEMYSACYRTLSCLIRLTLIWNQKVYSVLGDGHYNVELCTLFMLLCYQNGLLSPTVELANQKAYTTTQKIRNVSFYIWK